jgi:hypothetical protein
MKKLLAGLGFSVVIASGLFANVPKLYQGIVFAMLDSKDYSDTIWRMIRPEYQKPFWKS